MKALMLKTAGSKGRYLGASIGVPLGAISSALTIASLPKLNRKGWRRASEDQKRIFQNILGAGTAIGGAVGGFAGGFAGDKAGDFISRKIRPKEDPEENPQHAHNR